MSVTAFKINTHVYVGASVLQDAADGAVNIPPFGEYQLEPAVFNALSHSPKAFLYGNVGPDFFPDILTGQLVVHPGADLETEQWNSDDWFAHLLSNRSTLSTDQYAFTLGFLGHGAADFWAHTYVNTYSGNIFNLKDDDGLEAEIRHYLVEGYIGEKTPPLETSSGALLDSSIAMIDHFPGQFPSAFIRDRLIYDDAIQEQYNLKAPHIQLMATLHKKLPELIDEVDSKRDDLYKAIGEVVLDVQAEATELAPKKHEIHEEFCQTMAPDIEITPDSLDPLAAEVDRINNTFLQYTEGTNEQKEHVEAEILQLTNKYLEDGFTQVDNALDEFSNQHQKLLNAKQSLTSTLQTLNSTIAAKSCELLEEVYQAPMGIHEFLVDNLPFGEEASELLFWSLDPTGNLDWSNPLDPAGIFGGGSDSEPPKVTVTTRDLAYFNMQIDNYNSMIEGLSTAPLDEATKSQYRQDFLQQIFEINTLKAGMDADSQLSIYQVNGSTKAVANSSSVSVFCSTGAVLSDQILYPINSMNQLEQKLITAETTAREAAGELRQRMLDAANEMYSLKYIVDKKSEDLAVGIAQASSAYGVQSVQFSNVVEDKIRDFSEDLCSDIREVEEFVDVGAIEGMPFVAAYFVDWVAKYAGYTSEESNTALYTEWLYYGLKVWQQGVDIASEGYVDAQRQMVDKLLSKPANGESPEFSETLEPLDDWLWCQAPLLMGVNYYTTLHVCVAKEGVEDLMGSYNNAIAQWDRLTTKYLLPGVPEELVPTKTNIDKLNKAVLDQIKAEIIKRNEYMRLYDYMFSSDNNDIAVLNYELSKTSNNYLTFDEHGDNFTTRADAEMYLKNGYLDPDKFAPVYNAIVMSKLALLGANELNRLISDAGGHSYRYGTHLFWSDDEAFNILIGAVRSLDGNHQWLENTPPYIRASGPGEENDLNLSYGDAYLENRFTGGESSDKTQYQEMKTGFLLYRDEAARRNVFNKIFRGPINAALETPDAFSLERVIPASYPYRPCKQTPYPDGVGDQSCMMSWLIPVLMLGH